MSLQLVTRLRGESANGGVSVEMEVNNGGGVSEVELPECISSVIPGWFSEISPMWPGNLFFSFCYTTRYDETFMFVNMYSSCCEFQGVYQFIFLFPFRIDVDIFSVFFFFFPLLEYEFLKFIFFFDDLIET